MCIIWYNNGMQKGIDHTGISIIFFCHDGEGNFLLSKRSANCRDEHGTWDPGGGGLELHDTVLDTLRKEIKEEYCTAVLAHEFLGYRDVHRHAPQKARLRYSGATGEHNGQKTHWLALDFKVLVDKNKAKNGEPHKLDAIGWFRLDALPSPLHSQFPYFLEKYRDKLS